MNDGFVRCGSAVPDIKVADCAFNAEKIIEKVREAAENGCSVLVFPELCITGYTCGKTALLLRSKPYLTPQPSLIYFSLSDFPSPTSTGSITAPQCAARAGCWVLSPSAISPTTPNFTRQGIFPAGKWAGTKMTVLILIWVWAIPFPWANLSSHAKTSHSL